MESTQIFAQVDTKEGAPYDWMVFPLLPRRIFIGILGWLFGAIVGGLFFAFMAPIMIPHNYQSGIASAIFSTLILAIVLYVCLGSLWALYIDISRLRNRKQHIIIITPDDFVKQEGKKTIHVPLEYVRFVTARGAPKVDRSVETAREDGKVGSLNESVSSMVLGRRVAETSRRGSSMRKRMRTPTTLAFVDGRTDKEIVVVTDNAYGDPHLIAAYLKQFSAAKTSNTVVS